MKLLRNFLEISLTSISLTSILFMGIVFWNEIHGEGVLFVEPNRTIAFTELLVMAYGFGAVLGSFIRKMRE
jgi:hypothetical protein